MPFVKQVKNKAYFKRFQVKYRRRRGAYVCCEGLAARAGGVVRRRGRGGGGGDPLVAAGVLTAPVRARAEGKTDYRARKRLVVQEKNKYQSHRFRFVVRFTNTTVITQVIYAEIDGDKVLSSAYSSELPRYGLKVGLKNYAAAYATGLLLARRTLQKLGMDSEYSGNTTVDGNVYQPEELEERRPFKALLDVGTRATTTGARLFGALKGASDGGFFVPHNEKRFPGYDREAKEYNADVHRARIFGQHVADYMRSMSEDDPEKFAKQFSQYVTEGVEADGVEEMYTKTHAVRVCVCVPGGVCACVMGATHCCRVSCRPSVPTRRPRPRTRSRTT